MDGVQELVGVTIVAATNRPDVIVRVPHLLGCTQAGLKTDALGPQDSALMRPGRLDRILYVGPPDLEGRIEILRIRTQKMSVEPGLDLEQIAGMVRPLPLPVEPSLINASASRRRKDVLGRKSRRFVRKRRC